MESLSLPKTSRVSDISKSLTERFEKREYLKLHCIWLIFHLMIVHKVKASFMAGLPFISITDPADLLASLAQYLSDQFYVPQCLYIIYDDNNLVINNFEYHLLAKVTNQCDINANRAEKQIEFERFLSMELRNSRYQLQLIKQMQMMRQMGIVGFRGIIPLHEFYTQNFCLLLNYSSQQINTKQSRHLLTNIYKETFKL